MAGMFDFKSAESILKERQAATKKNTMGIIASNKQSGRMVAEQAAADVGGLLTAMAMFAMGKGKGGGDAAKLTKSREMGEVVKSMEANGVGTEGSGYGPGVMEQARQQDVESLGVLPPDMQKAENTKRKFEALDTSNPKAYYTGLYNLGVEEEDFDTANSAAGKLFQVQAQEKARALAAQNRADDKIKPATGTIPVESKQARVDADLSDDFTNGLFGDLSSDNQKIVKQDIYGLTEKILKENTGMLYNEALTKATEKVRQGLSAGKEDTFFTKILGAESLYNPVTNLNSTNSTGLSAEDKKNLDMLIQGRGNE